MNTRDAVTLSAGIKLAIFTVVSVLVTGLLAVIMGIRRSGKQWRYLPEMLLSFPILHIAYGTGFWQGLYKLLRQYRKTQQNATLSDP